MTIGNIYSYHDVEVYVLAISFDGATFGYFKNSIGFERKFGDADFPKPTPARKELLEKLGFELVYDDDGSGDYDMIISAGKKNIIARRGVWGLEILQQINEGVKPTLIIDDLEYIHQLQNLVFELTGTELKFK